MIISGLDTYRERIGVHPIFAWDTASIAQAEVDYCMSDLDMTESEAWEHVNNYYDLFACEWEYFLSRVQEWLDKQDQHIFYVEARGLGWRNHNGYNLFVADEAKDFVRGLVGLDCDYTLRCWEAEADNCLMTASVYHHDSPTGESRHVYTLKQMIDQDVQDTSIHTLQKFLTGWLDANCGSYHYLTDIEEITDYLDGKPRRNLNRSDFADLFCEMYREETLTESEIVNLQDTIKYYAELETE